MFIETVHNIIRHDPTKNNVDISKVFMNYGTDSLQNPQRVRIMNTVQRAGGWIGGRHNYKANRRVNL